MEYTDGNALEKTRILAQEENDSQFKGNVSAMLVI